MISVFIAMQLTDALFHPFPFQITQCYSINSITQLQRKKKEKNRYGNLGVAGGNRAKYTIYLCAYYYIGSDFMIWITMDFFSTQGKEMIG